MKSKLARIAALILLVGACCLVPLASPEVPAAHAAKGAYGLNLTAADAKLDNAPYLPTYTKVPATAIACPTGGRADDPMRDAVFANPVTSTRDSVDSLQPADMALGQVVPFELLVSVSGSTSPENGVIEFTLGFAMQTTNSSSFGYDPNYPGKWGDHEVYCAFVDYGDKATMDPGNNARVDSWTDSVVGTEIRGIFQVSGLDDGDQVVVEIWPVLADTWPQDGATGNVQTRAISARTMPASPDTPQNISWGTQTVPLLQVGQFPQNCVDLSIAKTDGDVSVPAGGLIDYTITVGKANSTVVANDVAMVDTLDPYLKFVSLTSITDPNHLGRTCAYSGVNVNGGGGQLTCNLQSMTDGEIVTIVFRAQILEAIPAWPSTVETGTCAQNDAAWDVCNQASASSLNCDPSSADNTDSEPNNVIDPTAVEFLWFRAAGRPSFVKVGWQTTSELDNVGFNLYRSESRAGERTKLNGDLISSLVPPGSPFGAIYSYRDRTAQPGVGYYYWLEDVDLYGRSGMHGPAKARLASQ